MADIDIANDLAQVNTQLEQLVGQLNQLNTQRDQLNVLRLRVLRILSESNSSSF